ncbi:MAG: hypothetical protein JZU65_14915 [Chlorobium sp.]|nr:hypothetical protein [Chlorobium sp.]
MNYDSPLQSICGIAKSFQSLNRQAVREYTPLVEGILHSRSCDSSHIEHTLDGLLSFCGYKPALVLYKKLCLHFWNLDQIATAFYIDAYREMWDSEENEITINASAGGEV